VSIQSTNAVPDHPSWLGKASDLERIMKIQAARAEEVVSTQQTQQTDRTRGARSDSASQVSDAVVTDRFEKSPDAQLAEMAVRAATTSPDIRPEVVERAKQKLMSGELGADTERLAERMIDSLLGS
jgi:flagellar biosynthesis anti-sigma factor FlgM